ncbi:MAG: hypothetical protein JJE12_14455 [Anaerolineales bacterium]|nr:hypothetical protein [Anaerolineales bacterium]
MDPEELTFKDLEQDIERCCVETGETMMGIPIVRGYDQARDFVFNAYLDNQQYQEVVDYLLKQNWEWVTNKYFDHASEIFVEGREIYYIKQLWHAVLVARSKTTGQPKLSGEIINQSNELFEKQSSPEKARPRLKKVNVRLRGSLGSLKPC